MTVKRTGLVVVNTGNGKGKTTAALGTAMRAVGHGHKVLMVQFVKGPWTSGEQLLAPRLAPGFEFVKTGKGFFKIMGDRLPEEEHKEAARLGFEFAREKVLSGGYDLVILDEINNAIADGLLPVEPLLELIDAKPAEMHLILTGRNAHPDVLKRAHLVTEMVEIKHPYREGILAQKGIDF
ncbi:MAG: cob(I)yrinic acid a,c-diamide adenosyltransferase [Candidatus Polarisedimenticolia bacterium]